MPFKKVDPIAEAIELQEMFKDNPKAKEEFYQFELAHRKKGANMTTTIILKMETELYKKIESILSKNNLTFEESLNLLFAETVRQGKIPFDYTEADIEEARKNPFVTIID